MGRTLLTVVATGALAASLMFTANPAAADVDKTSLVSTFSSIPAVGDVETLEFGAGSLYATTYDAGTTRIVRFAADGSSVTVVAGGGTSTAENAAATSTAIETIGFTVAPDGTIFYADLTLKTVRKIGPDGVVTTVAGNGSATASGDGGPALQAGMSPTDVAVDAAGNLLITDSGGQIFGDNEGNQRLRKVAGGTISTLADFSLPGTDNPRIPVAVDLDAFGNAYVRVVLPISGVDPQHDIVKVAPSGTMTSYFGSDTDVLNGGDFLDAAVTADGAVYIADRSNFASSVSLLPAPGTQTVLNESTFMGTDPAGPIDGPLATAFMMAGEVAASPSGDLYLAHSAETELIRKVTNQNPTPAARTVQPARILDTRPATLTGYTGDKPGAGSVVSLQVAGRGGVPASGAAAVILSIVITDATNAGYVTVWPSGITMPLASSLNAQRAGDTVANLVTIPVGADGKVNLFTEAGGHLIADVAGWLPPGDYVPMTPTRLLDTRQASYGVPKPAAGSTTTLKVAGTAGVPTSGVSAVTLNVTGTDATAAGFVTVWPSLAPRPNASSLNLDAGGTAPNQVTIPLGTDGSIAMFSEMGTHLIVDIVGYYNATSGFTSLVPTRVMDTRPAPNQLGYTGDKPAAGATVPVKIAGVGGVPATGAGAVILNITATDATAPGFVSAWPVGTPQPNASVLNLSFTGQTRPNAVVLPLGADGSINLFTEAGTHLIVDVTGWFPG